MSLSIRDYLAKGPATSKEIQAETGLSQAGVSRQLKKMKDRIIRLPGGRPPRYALSSNAFGMDDKIPLFSIDVYGNAVTAAVIRPLAHGGFFVDQQTDAPSVILGESRDGVFDDLPYFLSDLRPQGFLGRQVAADMASRSEGFPTDPRYWSTDHIGRYLVSNGDDLPGNFKIGQQTHLRVRRSPIVNTRKDYPELADRVLNGVIPGSSAGGEQPKFTAFCGDLAAHVIVKFSPRGNSEVSRRWRDILITEYHATEAIRRYQFPAAETQLIEKGGRLFLESQRFDRTGEYGRKTMVSLQSVDAEFVGLGTNWPEVIEALHLEKLVSWQYVYDTNVLWGFGRLINNTDMHLGNLSLGIDGSVFKLLPVYDMCSMGFAPKAGEVRPFNFKPKPSKIERVDIEQTGMDIIIDMAREFWNSVADDDRISAEFRGFLKRGNPMDRFQEEIP